MADSQLDRRIETVRRFNRFYTKQIGVLREGLLESKYSLTQARIIYELAHRNATSASELSAELGLDPGYLSRLLRGLENQDLIVKKRFPDDRRRSLIGLSREGKAAFGVLHARSRAEIAAMLEPLTKSDQARLVAAMSAIERLLAAPRDGASPVVLRNHEPGDMGWITHLHGKLYSEVFGWDETFEALVAGITADFINNFDAAKERCWVAEVDGEVVGSVFIVNAGDNVAKLRLMIVDVKAQGLGIGKQLLKECIRFSRRKGYHKITLWTNSILLAARGIYAAAGFELVHEEPHNSFGVDLIGETWELDLDGDAP